MALNAEVLIYDGLGKTNLTLKKFYFEAKLNNWIGSFMVKKKYSQERERYMNILDK